MNLTEFFKLDGTKSLITLFFVIIGLVILFIFIWFLAFGKLLLGQEPNYIILGLISGFSPLFGIAIAYVYTFKTMSIYIFILINLLSVLQFFHWYYLSCLTVYLSNKLFKKEELTFYQK